jgi:hypothetical protein
VILVRVMPAEEWKLVVFSLFRAVEPDQVHSSLVVFVLNCFVILNVYYTAVEQVNRLCFLIIF